MCLLNPLVDRLLSARHRIEPGMVQTTVSPISFDDGGHLCIEYGKVAVTIGAPTIRRRANRIQESQAGLDVGTQHVLEQALRRTNRLGPLPGERVKLLMRAHANNVWQDYLLGKVRGIAYHIDDQAITLVWCRARAATEHLDVEARRAGRTGDHQGRYRGKIKAFGEQATITDDLDVTSSPVGIDLFAVALPQVPGDGHRTAPRLAEEGSKLLSMLNGSREHQGGTLLQVRGNLPHQFLHDSGTQQGARQCLWRIVRLFGLCQRQGSQVEIEHQRHPGERSQPTLSDHLRDLTDKSTGGQQ